MENQDNRYQATSYSQAESGNDTGSGTYGAGNAQGESGSAFSGDGRDAGNGSYGTGANSYGGGSYGNSSSSYSSGSYANGGSSYGSGNSAYGQNSQNGSYAQGAASYGAGYGGTASGSYGGSYGNNYSQYQNGGYQYDANYKAAYEKPQKKREKPPKKERKRSAGEKKGGFGITIAKCAAIAIVFGLVAGVVFEGVHVASGKLFASDDQSVVAEGTSSQQALSESGSVVETTSVSSTYVAMDVSDIGDEVMPSIVAVTNVSQTEYQSFWGGSQTYESTSVGTGIVVSQDDSYLYIATNNHVVSGATSLTVTFNDDTTVSGEIKGTDPSTDLAVISVAISSLTNEQLGNIKVATLGNSDNLRVGESCIAIGNALGYGQSVTTGVISALNREVTVQDSSTGTNYTASLIQTDAAINPGNSGGALLNASGEVIGISSVKFASSEVEGMGYAIPISTAIPIINDLITLEKVDESQSAYLGIYGIDVSDDVASAYDMPIGAYVTQVIEGSAADQAGIKKGDIITGFDGRTITSMDDLSSRMEYYAAGTTVDITLQRAAGGEYEEMTISVTLGKKS